MKISQPIIKPAHALAAVLLLAATSALRADGDTAAGEQSTIDVLRAQIQELDEKLRILERKQENADETNSSEFKKIPTIKADDKGLTVESKDKSYQFRLRGLLQTDFRSYIGSGEQNESLPSGQFTPTDQNDGFVLRRVRPRFQGKLWDRLNFEFTPELTWSNGGSTGNTVRIIDTYGDFKIYDELNVKFGLFKTPLGLERLQGAANTAFPERGLATNLVPTRDIGVQLWGRTWDQQLTYSVGFFNGTVNSDDSRGNLDLDEGEDFVAGIFVEPFKNNGPIWAQGLGVGFAGSIADNDSTNANTTSSRLRYRSAGQDPFFDTNTANFGFNGESYRLNPQAYYYYGPFSFLGEYVLSSYEFVGRNSALASFGRGGKVESQAATLQVGYVLTGEDASYNGVKPLRPAGLSEGGGFGAWELVARFNFLTVSDDAFKDFNPGANNVDRFAAGGSASEAIGYGVGLNWYVNTNTKFQLAYEHTQFNGYSGRQTATNAGQAAQVGAGDRPSEDLVTARFQLAF
ncbi:MAG: porin [Candidatus Methylacidiphilales bacterium]|nr:porin [Candidatus Methylacidiphilales bacterium]